MKLVLEAHANAPELNRAYVFHKGALKAVFRVPGVTSIRDARARLFPAVSGFRRVATIATVYPDSRFSRLDRKNSGTVNSYQHLLSAVRITKMKTSGGVLLDGSAMPAANVSVTSITSKYF